MGIYYITSESGGRRNVVRKFWTKGDAEDFFRRLRRDHIADRNFRVEVMGESCFKVTRVFSDCLFTTFYRIERTRYRRAQGQKPTE